MSDSNHETLTEVRGDLVLAALCVGQFQAPCQIDSDRILVRADEMLIRALEALGLSLAATVESFTPAPLFVPETVILEQVSRSIETRRVATHVSRFHGDEPEDEDEAASAQV